MVDVPAAELEKFAEDLDLPVLPTVKVVKVFEFNTLGAARWPQRDVRSDDALVGEPRLEVLLQRRGFVVKDVHIAQCLRILTHSRERRFLGTC